MSLSCQGTKVKKFKILHPYTRTDRTTQSVQLYRWDDPFRTNVHPRRVDAHSCIARITADVQLCGRAYACHTVVRSDSFAMHSSIYYLAGSGLTFYNNAFRVKAMPVNCKLGPMVMPLRIPGLNVQPETVSLRCKGRQGWPLRSV